MAKDRAIFDFSIAGVRRMAKQLIDQCDGLWWWELTRARDQRTLAQNAYLWGVVYPRVANGMYEAWGEPLTSEEVHEFLKDRFLKKPIVNKSTGEVVGHTEPSTASLDTEQCREYIDQIIRFAADYLNTEIPIALRAAERKSA